MRTQIISIADSDRKIATLIIKMKCDHQSILTRELIKIKVKDSILIKGLLIILNLTIIKKFAILKL